jgi:hypothetical protein
MFPLFWGIPVGMFLAFSILMPFAQPSVFSGMADRLQQTALAFGILLVLSAPLLIWGANRWVWDAEGIEFRGVFRHQKLAWSDITKVEGDDQRGYGISTAQGVALRMSPYVSGSHLILAALYHYRRAAFEA